MANEGRRPERVGELVLRELSALLLKDLHDPRLKGVTLTGVRMTDDLRHGRVYFSHFQGHSAAEAVQKGFRSAIGYIRKRIGRELGLRYTPDLDFEFDAGSERAARIETLLKESREKTRED